MHTNLYVCMYIYLLTITHIPPFPSHRINGVKRLCRCNTVQSEKLQSLTRNLVEKRKLKGVSFRCIVFVQQRISAYVLSKYLNSSRSCNNLGLRAG